MSNDADTKTYYHMFRDWVLGMAWKGVEAFFLTVPLALVAVLIFKIGEEFGKIRATVTSQESLAAYNILEMWAILGIIAVTAFVPFLWYKNRPAIIEFFKLMKANFDEGVRRAKDHYKDR